jgi:protein-L-isoaspartate(D-aspartate) O-methyltransferase
MDRTISQPTLVVEMTRQLSPEPESRVLEIGTGSGYQTAFLSGVFSAQVLYRRADNRSFIKGAKTTDGMGFENIHYRVGAASIGWMEQAPFDRIIVTAAADGYLKS